MKILLDLFKANISPWKFTESLQSSLGVCYASCRQLPESEEINFVFEEARIVMSETLRDPLFFDAELTVCKDDAFVLHVFEGERRYNGKLEMLPSLLLTLVKEYDTDVDMYD